MHRSPLFVNSHWGVNFFVFYFRMFGRVPHHTATLTLWHERRALVAATGGLLRARAAARKELPATPKARPSPTALLPLETRTTITKHHFFSENTNFRRDGRGDDRRFHGAKYAPADFGMVKFSGIFYWT